MTKDEMMKGIRWGIAMDRDVTLGDVMTSLHSKLSREEYREKLKSFENRLREEWDIGHDDLFDQSDELVAFVYEVLVRIG